jgi:hypothetical protein
MNQHIDTKRQYTYLKKIFDEGFFKLLGECNAFVAGGAISCLFTDRPINDFDIFFPSSDEIDKATDYLKKTSNWHSEFCSNLSITYKNQNPIAMNDPCEYGKTIVIGNVKLQIVTAFRGDVKTIFNTFDFFCCMGAFQFSNSEFVFDPYFFNDNMSRTLRYNYEGAANPLTTMFRVEKYKKYGYTLPMEEMMKIVFAIKNIKLATMSDMRAFLRMLPPGVYKKVLIGELIEKPLAAICKNFNNPEMKQKYDDFLASPCSTDSVIAILTDINTFIENMKDDILLPPVEVVFK